MSLTARTCVPCQGGIPPLSAEQARVYLEETPGWTLSPAADRVSRHFTFPDFRTAQAFVNKVGNLCETEGHHADISFGWGHAEIVFYTHKIRGLHENDFIMAAKVNALA
jgi:4a-hydroxytetrahydrobiopterin dehydratase